MPMSDERAADLVARIDRLSDKLTISEQQTEDTRVLANRNARHTKWLWSATAVLVLIVVGMSVVVGELRDLAEANKATQVKSCENANESREVQRTLWNGIASAPDSPNEPPPSATEVRNIELLLEYINTAFQERDCNDLDRDYPAPSFPKLEAEGAS
jgi:hypothetical protein